MAPRGAADEGGWFRRLRRGGRTPASIAADLRFEEVSHHYGQTPSVVDVTLEIAPGEIVCLLGNSGCGKTTLLRLAAGLETPSAGRILINGQIVSGGMRSVPTERRGVGLMFQDYALFPHLTNLANVMFGLRDLPRADAEREAVLALERVGLEQMAGGYPHTLSGGEQQRVALARAIAPRPAILLMDEPFSGLDRRLRDDVREAILTILRESHVTSLVVTHDPEEALRLGDRVALMRAGELIQVATPEEIYRSPKTLFAARFFCELNEVAGEIRSGRLSTPIGLFPAPGMVEGTAAIAAIRPQGIKLHPAGFCIPGKVEHRRFLGEMELLEIAVQGLERPIKARTRKVPALAPDGEIGIEVDPAEVLVFAASDA